MLIAVIIACLIVVAHVYFSHYFANKITVAVKKKITHKLYLKLGFILTLYSNSTH